MQEAYSMLWIKLILCVTVKFKIKTAKNKMKLKSETKSWHNSAHLLYKTFHEVGAQQKNFFTEQNGS